MPSKKAYTHIHYQDIINLIISLYYKNIYNIRVPYKWGNGRGMFFCQVLYIIYIFGRHCDSALIPKHQISQADLSSFDFG